MIPTVERIIEQYTEPIEKRVDAIRASKVISCENKYPRKRFGLPYSNPNVPIFVSTRSFRFVTQAEPK